MTKLTITRRAALGGVTTIALARPAIVRSQTTSKPLRIGLISDMNGPYRANGGPGMKTAVEMAVDDIGGTVLGRPIEVLQADDQNKPDVSSSIARQWIDDNGVEVLADGSATSSGLGVQQITKEKKIVYVICDPAATDFIGKLCTPWSFQFVYDTYALAKATGGMLTKSGGDSWFFITADYQFGYSLQENTEAFVKQAGGQVLGAVRAPLGTADFSNYLLQAKASGAKVIGLANAGTDLQNCIKQAAEFQLTQAGVRLATLLMAITDVNSLGVKTAQGLVLSDSFYWDLNDQTRAWTKRFNAKQDTPPTMQQAGGYAGILHYLKAVKAAGTTGTEAVAAKMHATPVSDFYNTDVRIDPNGCVRHKIYIWQVKTPAESKGRWDFYKPVATLDGKDAFPPSDMFGCTLKSS
jgi:branched-chain amino acid transport system substrate-binding protein